MIGLALIVLLLLTALGADLIASQGIDEQDLRKGLLALGGEFPLGTDEFGRDMLSRIIHGSRVSLQVGIIATVISALVGISLGAVAGYFGGRIDYVIQGMVDISWAFPTILMAIFLIAVLGPGLTNVMIAVGLVYWGGFARIVRGQVLSLREWEFVTAARCVGVRDFGLIFRHILPNTIAPIVVAATLGVANAILLEAYASFLGLGIQPPTASWGNMLDKAQPYLETAPWLWVFPGTLILLTILSINFLGDGLRDALDPRTQI